MSYEAHSLRYRDRFLTLPSIASFIADVIRERTGHYLIFSPSFSYQNALADALKRINPPHARFMIQPPRMTEQQKNAFLDRFRKKGDSRSLAGLTVIGSLFNEGIDLIGEELTGVIVIGTGLPGLSPERDILRQYYEEKSNRGYEYAFMWPGFNRVTQAAGRLIRSEDDFGIVLLIDDRYGRPDYRRLLPEEWHTLHTSDREEALGAIRSSGRISMIRVQPPIDINHRLRKPEMARGCVLLLSASSSCGGRSASVPDLPAPVSRSAIGIMRPMDPIA